MMIRPARVDDLPAIHDLLVTNNLLVDGVDYSDFSPPVLVAVRGQQTIGMVHALIGKPYAIISELAILPEHQNKGYAIKLLRAMELLLRSMGITALAAFVGGHRVRVISQLGRDGWSETGTGVMFVRSLT